MIVPSFKALTVLDSYFWKLENPVLEIQVQEWIGEFEARSKPTRFEIKINPVLS